MTDTPATPTAIPIKLEGEKDLIAIKSLPGYEESGIFAWTTQYGAKQDPAKHPWIIKSLPDGEHFVIHDCDQVGQEGATHVPRRHGKPRQGWAPAIAEVKGEARNVVLPYPQESGKDLRDAINDGHFRDATDLLIYCRNPTHHEVFTREGDGTLAPEIPEADKDPLRLAQSNLDHYGNVRENATLKFWRGIFYKWRRGRYQEILMSELRSRIWTATQKEFKRLWVAQDGDDERPATPHSVNVGLVNNIVEATQSIAQIPNRIELNTWLGGVPEDNEAPTARTTPEDDRITAMNKTYNYLACSNGILDIDRATLGNADDRKTSLMPHSSQWFSTVCLDYPYDPDATCPIWDRYMLTVMPDEFERRILQEWVGYLLTIDSNEQRMLCIEGAGGNGKSAFMAGTEAILGSDNCSAVSLDDFADQYKLMDTLGKLVNIATDVGDGEVPNLGLLKGYTSGDPITFEKKYCDPFKARPTARMMVSYNSRPKFRDKTDALWRRLLLIEFATRIPEGKKIKGMDKPDFWLRKKQLPGMLNWALRGRHRFVTQGRFTVSNKMEARIAGYKSEMNPARKFCLDSLEYSSGEKVLVQDVYAAYVAWCKSGGFKPQQIDNFGRTVRDIFPDCRRTRAKSMGTNAYFYAEIDFSPGIRQQFLGDF